MKFLLLLLSLIISIKSKYIKNLTDNQSVVINADGEENIYNLTNYTKETLYIISNITSLSTGGIIIDFETNDTFDIKDASSFSYGIGETEEDAIKNSENENNKIRALKKTLEQDMNTFSTLYFIKNNNKFGCLKVTGLKIKENDKKNLAKRAIIVVKHNSTSMFVLYGFGFAAVVLIVVVIVFLLCKKILKLRDQ